MMLPASASHYPALVDLLVIGGSGLLGMRIARQAQLAGHNVIATYHASVPPAVDVEWRQLDIRRRDDVTALARRARPDAVINAAYRQSDWETTCGCRELMPPGDIHELCLRLDRDAGHGSDPSW
jgi:NAD(P)-dependent dehydrogenase (short-subunit alcohol dehydrogenase family)